MQTLHNRTVIAYVDGSGDYKAMLPWSKALVNIISCLWQGSALSGATIDDDPDAECRRCCAFNFPVSIEN